MDVVYLKYIKIRKTCVLSYNQGKNLHPEQFLQQCYLFAGRKRGSFATIRGLHNKSTQLTK